MKKVAGYGVGPSCANAPDYELSLISVARNKNCPCERASIEFMTHEVIYSPTISYGPVKEKVNNRIPHSPKIKGNITKNKFTDYKHTIHRMNVLSGEYTRDQVTCAPQETLQNNVTRSRWTMHQGSPIELTMMLVRPTKASTNVMYAFAAVIPPPGLKVSTD